MVSTALGMIVAVVVCVGMGVFAHTESRDGDAV